MLIELAAKPPFSLGTIIHSHGWAQLAPFTFEEDPCSIRYVARLASGQVIEVAVAEAHAGIAVEVAGRLAAADQAQLEQDLTWMFGLDMDFGAFYRQASKEPKLSHVAKGARGRILRCPTLFEDTVKTILTTNTSWVGTKRMVARLVEQFGDPLPSDLARQAFPTPQRLARASVAQLRKHAGLGYRAPYVRALARQVASGERDLEALKDFAGATVEVREALLDIKGVGGYAAANLLMLLGRYDHIPMDSWAFRVVSHEWHEDQPIGPDEVQAAFDRWGEWKGLAFWFWNWDYMAQA